jgi:peptidoglycan/LPS O-acetylase OafA/YrhL
MRASPDIFKAEAGSVPTASEKYVGELDGIRAVAVSLVVSAHYRLIPYVPGGFGVTLFFFLSGYLITTLFFSEYKTKQEISIRQFYLRRWLRLTPPLIISIVIANIFYWITCNSVGGQPVPLGTNAAALLYYTNYYDLYVNMDQYKVIPFGICWSLAVEEHFYLLWPWIIRSNIGNAKRLLSIIVILCVAVFIWRFVARYFLHLPTDYTYMATDCRIDSILYGALLRTLFETPWASGVMRFLRSPVCRILAVLALLSTFVIRDDDFRETIRYTIQGIALMPLFTAVLSDSPKTLVRRVLSSPPMVLIGRLSYSIYLFHLMARTPGEVYFGSPFGAGATISGLLLTGAVAYAAFIYVERPMARLRHRFRAKANVPPIVATPNPLSKVIIGIETEQQKPIAQ